jgi:hypothetical protein
MAKRPTPWYGHDTGDVSGLDLWSDNGDWSDYGEPGAWGGTAETNPWNIPEPIGGFEDYSLGYGPEGAGPGLGPDALMPFNQPDLGGDPSGLGALFAGDSDYGLQFDPTQTAGRSWRPTYGVTGPEGDTGYHLTSEVPYSGFPWVDPSQTGGNGGNGGNGVNGGDQDRDIAGPTLGPTELDPTEVLPGAMSEDLQKYPGSELLNLLGQIPYSSTSAPLTPGAYQDIFTSEVAADPLSRKANLALEDLIHRGGVVATPFTSQAERTIGDILQQQGQTIPTEGEATVFQNLSDAVQNFGEAPLTTTEAQSQQAVQNLLASGGVLPQDQAAQATALEAARSPLDRLRAAQLEQGQAALASRGLLGQGPEAAYMERLESQLAPMYTEAAQQISLEEGERADARYRQALDQLNQQAMAQRLSTDQRFAQARSLQTEIALDRAQRQDSRLQNAIQQASNLTVEQSRNLVDSVNALTGVQQMRTDAALEVLDRNMAWNQFLAEYGLERDKTMAALQQGRYEFLLPLLQEYFRAAAMAAEGYVTGSG